MSGVPAPPMPLASVPATAGYPGGKSERSALAASSSSSSAKFCSNFMRGPLPDGETIDKQVQAERSTLFHTCPDAVLPDPAVPYFQLSRSPSGVDLAAVLAKTPLPKGASDFSSIHIVAAPGSGAAAEAQGWASAANAAGKQARSYTWPALEASNVAGEFVAFYRITSDMILNGADRASLLLFVAAEGSSAEMAVAAILGMLPFRGVQVAFVSPAASRVDPLERLVTASGLYEYCATQPERMGRCPLAAVFGPLPDTTFRRPLAAWKPLKPEPLPEEKPAPFKIGALELPMITFEGRYEAGVERLAELLRGHFGDGLFPVVAVGETGDALGYGTDVLAALENVGCSGYYFAHASGESFKRPDAYGKPELLKAIAAAKSEGRRIAVVAVGGGVNGNAMGMIAAMTGSDFVEVPTTLMHYNDATTSAKKAFSLVVDGQILSKNILGTFYLPQLVFCVSEVFLTLSSCSVHAAVGEAAKTMSMLGKASSSSGQEDFHNILGATEFASDFTRIIKTTPGFERLITFLRETLELKQQAIQVGRELRERASGEDLQAHRRGLLERLRSAFHDDSKLPAEGRAEVMRFLTVINEEVIKAKAMFLAYSDPFEKYRALLFEYAHTLGHGVEAFMNGLYQRAQALDVDYSDAFRLHGQCVGMAVLWAGEMSLDMGHLEKDGYMAHQSLVYLFNRFGGFDFAPLRRLCDELDVSCEEFTEGVLKVVRRDNKRGYCKCAPGSSVDQLVRERPGCLVRSSDPSAELRYLVEVSEDSQRRVLERAFDGEYDKVLVCKLVDESQPAKPQELALVRRSDFEASASTASSARAAAALDVLLRGLYGPNTVFRDENADRKAVAPASAAIGSLFHERPGSVLADPAVPYVQLPCGARGPDAASLLAGTPLPKGAAEFSSLHVVAAPGERAAMDAQGVVRSARTLAKKACFYQWPALKAEDVDGEYEAFFRIASDLILDGADRTSLLVFVAEQGSHAELAIAAILGMLPFRGVQVAFVTSCHMYVDPLGRLVTASGLFEYFAAQPERMGRCPVAAMFGPLPSRTFSRPLAEWQPLRPAEHLPEEKPAPFKIGALDLPMVTYEGRYEAGIERLAGLLRGHFGGRLFPVVAVGESGDALGYGADVLAALEARGCSGFYFAHASGESFKRPDAYGKPELLAAIAAAKKEGRRVVVIAVGGGVNGNAMGMIAALTGADFVEVPTTLMHYNDATTSAKKAFSLVVNGTIMSKNILGTFYLPQLVYCVSEVFLTLSSSSVHAAVGEAAKTMSMLGKANTSQGQQDFHNILGAAEFASDFTRIIRNTVGFEQLILFLKQTKALKDEATALGLGLRRQSAEMPSEERQSLLARRAELLSQLRNTFHGEVPEEGRAEVVRFLTAINEEVIKAKAMFLAYSDPFEKYRALLFEYAHTLGHGVEAFMNGLYQRAQALDIDCSDAFRLHGQCVGMAVVWAGEMSLEIGHLSEDGYMAHQSLVYLFNRFGGFDCRPLRRLCDALEVSCAEFCEGVLKVVRRDNKRGYCKCAPGSSVDQLVRDRPGCLVRSSDPSAELRYLVEVSEESQRRVLERAFDGEFDKVLVCSASGSAAAATDASSMPANLELVSRDEYEASAKEASSADAAAALDALLGGLYGTSQRGA